MEILKTFDEKIAIAVEKVKTVKEERDRLRKRVEELEGVIKSRDLEIERLNTEKASIKQQIEDLLNELDSIGLQ